MPFPFLGGIIGNMGEHPDQKSNIVQYIEIDLEIFQMRNITNIRPIISSYKLIKLQNNIDEILLEAIKNDGFSGCLDQIHQQPAGNNPRKMNKLSLWSDYKCYFLIKLSKYQYWRFNKSSPSFTTSGDDRYTNSIFFNSNIAYIKKDGTLGLKHFDIMENYTGESLPDTRWGYFLFDGEKAMQYAAAANTEGFVFPFNIHVDLLDPVNGTSIGLIIDPDVGHPGGGGAQP